MNNEEITFINNNDGISQIDNSIENINNYQNTNTSNVNNNVEDDYIVLPDWDLTPPFDSLDRSDMS